MRMKAPVVVITEGKPRLRRRRPFSRSFHAMSQSWLALRAIVAEVTMFVLGAFVMFLVWSEMSSATREIVITATPKSIAEAGFTPAIVAERVRDRVVEIATPNAGVAELQPLALNSDHLAITVPGSDISLDRFTASVRQFLGIPRQRYSGELVESPGGLEMRLRRTDGTLLWRAQIDGATADSVTELVRGAAEGVLAEIAPALLAGHLEETAPARARAIALAVLADNQRSAEEGALANLVLAQIEFGHNPQASLEFLQRALLRLPRNATLHQNIAVVHAHLGQYERYLEHIRVAEDLEGISFDSARAKCVALSKLNRRDEAFPICADALAAAKHRSALIQEAQLRDLVADGYNNLGVLFLHMNNVAAESFFRTALRLSPEDSTYLTNLGVSLAQQGRNAEALRATDEAIKHGRVRAREYANKGVILLGLSQLGLNRVKLREATESLEQAVRLAPKDAFALRHLGLALRRGGDMDRATEILRQAIVLEPTAPESYIWLTGTLRAKGRNLDAAAVLAAAKASCPSSSEVFLTAAKLNLDLGKHDSAISDAKAAAALGRRDIDPLDYQIYDIWARALFEQGRYENAARMFEAVTVLKPGDPFKRYLVARAYRHAANNLSGTDADRVLMLTCNWYAQAIAQRSGDEVPLDLLYRKVAISGMKEIAKQLGPAACKSAA